MSPQRLPGRRRPKSSHSIKTRETEAAKSSQTIDTVEFPVKKKKRSRPSRAERIDRKKESKTNPIVVIAIVAILGGGAYFISTQTNSNPTVPGIVEQPVQNPEQSVTTPQKVEIPTQDNSNNTPTKTLLPLDSNMTTNQNTNANGSNQPAGNSSKRLIPGKAIPSKIKVNTPGAILVIKNLDEQDQGSVPTASTPEKSSDNLVASSIKGLLNFSSKGKSQGKGMTEGYLFDMPAKANIPQESANTKVIHLDSDQLVLDTFLKFGDHYEITAHLDGQATEVFKFQAAQSMSNSQPTGISEVEVQFSPEQIRGFQLSATCVLKSKNSQSFSGFLFGNRKTVATSVRALTTSNIENIQIIFNQGGADEKTITGAKLLHFDAVEDVALLELPEELIDGTPYYISGGTPEKEQRFIIVGEESEANKNIVETFDLKNFSLNQKIKPTAIGGPIAKEGTLQALGIVTSHLHNANLINIDSLKSQAVIISLADVPFQLLMDMDIETKYSKQREMNSRFEKNFELLSVARAAERLSHDGNLYSEFCLTMLGEFMAYIAEATLDIPEQAPESVIFRQKKKAALDFKRKDGRKIATTLRKEMTPELQFDEKSEAFQAILENPKIDSQVKDALNRSLENFKQIKKSSVIILKTSSNKDPKTDEEYLEWMTGLTKDLETNCNDVITLVNHAVMN